MRIAGIIQDSIVDGPGLRFVVFTQGCSFRCEGCHNQHTWDKKSGFEMSIDDIISQVRSNSLTDGLTLSGGEPFDQAADCAGLAAAVREDGLNVWVFSGYTFEELFAKAKHDSDVHELLSHTDVLVDGRYIVEERTLSRKWCGSSNQRVLDVQKSILEEKGVLYYDGNGQRAVRESK